MARGRKKDLTIPPTRSLVQQRDYRARRALYVANLEERCHKAEEENAQLRKELAEAKDRLVNPAVLVPETAAASSELMHHLSLTKDALDKFNRLVFSSSQGTNRAESPLSGHAVLPSASYHPDSATPSSFASSNFILRNDNRSRRRKELYVDDSHPPYSPQSPSTSVTSHGPASDANDVCCGGIFDCDGFCSGEEEQPDLTQRETSGLRSTNHDP